VARAQVADGIDPIEAQKASAAADAATVAPDTFADVTVRWLARQSWTDGHGHVAQGL